MRRNIAAKPLKSIKSGRNPGCPPAFGGRCSARQPDAAVKGNGAIFPVSRAGNEMPDESMSRPRRINFHFSPSRLSPNLVSRRDEPL